MKINQINDIFIQKLNLNELGFSYINYNFDYNQGLFIHEIEQKINILTYGYGYNYKDLTHFEMGTKAFNSLIYFIEVEDILKKILGNQYSSKIYSIEDFRLRNFHGNIITVYNQKSTESEFRTIFQKNKLNLENIDFLICELEIAFTDFHLPFFERVKDIQYVNDEIINKVPQMELHKYISGQYMNSKKLIIMKLCNNQNYEEFKSWLGEAYLKGVKENPSKYKEKYQHFLELQDYLDSGKYLEVV
jgi:hypothetical protein